VPSILRGFSAPVKLTTNLTENDLLFLAARDSDLYNRWQAMQTLALRQLLRAVEEVLAGKTPRLSPKFLAALENTLTDTGLDAEYRSAFISLPSEGEIAIAIGSNVDPEAVYNARTAVRAKIGKALSEQLLHVYQTEKAAEPYSPDPLSVGKRALRNAALAMMTAAGGRAPLSLAAEHFRTAANMTDQLAALGMLSLFDNSASRETFNAFYRQWREEPLVLDKWFGLQASSPLPLTLDRVAELVAHPLFTLENPNRVRSVYNVFAYGNPVRFNDASGRGYTFVADAVITIDSFNPQIAARLAGAFESWRMVEPGRQALARNALDKIAAKSGLSRDCFEIVSKILS
jgi:aminopeptidase N